MTEDLTNYTVHHVAAEKVRFPKNDRAWLSEQQTAARREQRADEELRHYEVMGAGLAVFCLSFWEAIREAEPVSAVRWTHEEALRLLEAAVRGR
jgi:hypothetical protein